VGYPRSCEVVGGRKAGDPAANNDDVL
jgi:hypothetical protein